MTTHHVICTCLSAEHDIRFVKNNTNGDVWLEVQLYPHHGFFSRLWRATKYIFGYNSKYGHWDCTLISPEEGNKLYHFLKRFKDVDASV